MEKIVFDLEKLNKADQKLYGMMSDSEKISFERNWIQTEELKVKRAQLINSSKERVAREQKILADKERKERAHRLCERGAILEAYIENPLDFTNDEVKEIVIRAMKDQAIKSFIDSIRKRKVTATEEISD